MYRHTRLFRAIAVPCIAIACCCLIACRPEQRVQLVQEESFFSGYERKGETVTLTCYLTFDNPYSSAIEVNVYGDFSQDVEHGLLKEAVLIGLCDGEELLVLAPGKTGVYVTFAGEYGGMPQRYNRELPGIDVQLAEPET